MKGNMLILHGGAPTAVMNASLYGAITAAREYAEIGRIYAAVGGSGGLLEEKILDLSNIGKRDLSRLLHTPASAIGTSRDILSAEDYRKMENLLRKYQIRYVFFNGGNGTMDACGRLFQVCRQTEYDVQIMGIPKTIDNDIAVTDHAPGYGSAARYLASTVSEITQDVRSMPIHVCVIEAMGRNAGWLTAASALAQDSVGGGPDLIYLPEHPFDEDQFLADVEKVFKKGKGAVVVASEGLKRKTGEPIVEPVFTVGRSVYYGDVGAHLAQLVTQRLGIKSRNEKPGICGRSSIAFQSRVDREEAVMAGREAVVAAVKGESGKMIGFRRMQGSFYKVEMIKIPLEQVMLKERILPEHFINQDGNGVTEEFVCWCRPLIGAPLKKFISLRG